MITFLELANMVDATQEVGSWVYYYFTFFYDTIYTILLAHYACCRQDDRCCLFGDLTCAMLHR